MIAEVKETGSRYAVVRSAFGALAIIERADGSLESRWLRPGETVTGGIADDACRPDLVERLTRYFAGDGEVDFADVPTPAGPPFFRRCWGACRRIPRGETRSYAWLAREAGGDATAARAAGQAMRRNPLPVIVPCHRVVASDGRLHGYAGSINGEGPETALKAALLELEGALAAT